MHAFDTESWELLDATITGLPDAPASPLLEAVIDPATGHLVYPVRTACCARGTAIERNTAHHRPVGTRAIAVGCLSGCERTLRCFPTQDRARSSPAWLDDPHR